MARDGMAGNTVTRLDFSREFNDTFPYIIAQFLAGSLKALRD